MNSNRTYAILISLIVSIGGLLLGISVNVSGASLFFNAYFDLKVGSFWEGLAVSASMFGTFIGNFFVGNISDKLGRKKALLLAAFLFSFLTIGSALSPNYTIFLITRFIGGFGIGISLLVVPLYISEFAPSNQRGFLVSFNQLNINIGFLLAFVSNFVVNSMVDDPEMKWRGMLGIGFIFPVIYFILMIFVPESPRWLMQRGREEEARKIMLKAGGEQHANDEMTQIKESMAEEKAAGTDNISYGQQWSILLGKNMRRVLIVAFSIALFQMLSGINAVIFFAPKILNMAGLGGESFFQANLIGISMVVMTFISMFLIDRAGRKPLLYFGIVLIAASLFAAGFAFKKAEYTVQAEAIPGIESSLVEHAIKEKAKRQDANMYKVDRIESDNQTAQLYIGDQLATTIDLGDPDIQRAQQEAVILTSILNGIAGQTFTDEIRFFHGIRNSVEVQVAENVTKAKAGSLLLPEAYASEILAGIDNGQAADEIAADIATSKYSSYKGIILDNSISINSTIVLMGILGFVIGFSFSLGPITWILLSEVFPARIRGLGISVAGMMNGIASFLVATIFPIELEKFGSGTTYYIYAVIMVALLFIVFKWYPETKGKTLEQIEAELVTDKKTDVRKELVTG